jgi:hypothetical protein
MVGPVLRPQGQELVLQRLPGERVERAERLVQQQHARPGDERPGEGRALGHAARELLGQRVGEAGEVDAADGGLREVAAFGARQVAEPEGHVLADREPGHQPRLLEHEPDLARGAAHLAARDADGAARRPLQAGDEAEQGALAAARGAHDGHDLASADVEADAREGGVAVGVGLGEVARAEHPHLPRSRRARRAGGRGGRRPASPVALPRTAKRTRLARIWAALPVICPSTSR